MFSDYSVQIYGIRFDKTKNRRLNDNLLVIIIYTSKHSVSLASTVSGKQQEINFARLLFAFKHGYTAPFAWWMGFVFHIFPGKRGKLRLQAQCITQIKALPEVSFGRVLQNSIDISLFQRAFRNFSAVSGVGCRSLRNQRCSLQRP